MNDGLWVGGLLGVGAALVFIRLVSIERRLHRLYRLDAKLDALLKAAGIEFDPFLDVPPDVREALERGQTILAVQRFRQATGAGLKESKEWIDEMRRRDARSN
jgi:hypothetical protein